MYISVTPDRIQPAFWGSVNYVVAPDFRKLTASIEKFGILQPIVCQKSTACIIDGLHRWKVAKLLDLQEIPVVTVDVDDVEAALLHVNMNRNRGIVVNKFLSELLREIFFDNDVDPEEFQETLGLEDEEFMLLMEGSLIKMRKIKEHKYSPAWVPIESATGENVQIERPTGDPESL